MHLDGPQDAIQLNPVLFKRIKDLYDARESIGLNTEDAWLLERYYKDLIHAGAHLTEAQRHAQYRGGFAFVS